MAEEDDSVQPPAGKSKKKLFIIIGAVALLLIINVVAMIFIVKAMKPAAEEAKPAEAMPQVMAPTYISLNPPFVVNFEDQSLVRFLQVTVEVMTRDPEAVAAVEQHMPRIRNNLVLLFSSQSYQTLSSREGKIKIRKQALTEVQSILEEQTGKPGIDEIYFTSFVMQ